MRPTCVDASSRRLHLDVPFVGTTVYCHHDYHRGQLPSKPLLKYNVIASPNCDAIPLGSTRAYASERDRSNARALLTARQGQLFCPRELLCPWQTSSPTTPQQYCRDGYIDPLRVNTKRNPSDLLTKAVTEVDWNRTIDELRGLRPIDYTRHDAHANS